MIDTTQTTTVIPADKIVAPEVSIESTAEKAAEKPPEKVADDKIGKTGIGDLLAEVMKADPEKKIEIAPAAEPEKAKKPDASPKAREAFQRLEAERDEAVKKLAEHEARLKEWEPKINQATDFEKTRTDYETRLSEQARIIRAAAIERDPEFVEKFVSAKQQRQEQMRSLAMDVDKATVERAIAGDDSATEEVLDSLGANAKLRWGAHAQALTELDFQRTEAVKNADKTWQEMQSHRQEATQQNIAQQQQQTKAVATKVLDGIFNSESLKALGDDPEFRPAVEQHLEKFLGDRSPQKMENLLQALAWSGIQKRIVESQNNALEARQEEIAALTKERDEMKQKLEEQKTFIDRQSGGVPRGSVNGGSSNGSTEKLGVTDLMAELGLRR